MKCHRCGLKTNRKHWMPEECIEALKKKLKSPGMVSIENHGPTHNRDMPAAVIPLDQGYTVSQWCPTDDPADSKPEQVHVQFNMPAGIAPLVLRLKSARAVRLLVGTILEHARDVWSDENFD